MLKIEAAPPPRFRAEGWSHELISLWFQSSYPYKKCFATKEVGGTDIRQPYQAADCLLIIMVTFKVTLFASSISVA